MGIGKRNKIQVDPLNYNIGLIGLGGIGKTTVIYEMCEKLAHGTEENPGYLFMECGKEDGADALANINYVNCPDWSSEYDDLTNCVGFKTLVDDIIENKDTEYPNLRVVVVDTYDQLRKIVEPEVIRLHNKENPDRRVNSVKAAFGGYMAGDDKCDDLILDALWDLKKVGVHFIIIGHTKLKDIEDEITGESYTQLTTDMSNRSFNKIKTKLHFLGVASIDREIVKANKGKDGKDKNKIASESRVINFRDDNYAIDSKSRFAEIVDQIPLNADSLIEALTNAISAEAEKCGGIDALRAEQKSVEDGLKKRATEFSQKAREDKVKEKLEEEREKYLNAIKVNFKNSSKENQLKAKTILSECGCIKFTDPNMPVEKLKEISDILA